MSSIPLETKHLRLVYLHKKYADNNQRFMQWHLDKHRQTLHICIYCIENGIDIIAMALMLSLSLPLISRTRTTLGDARLLAIYIPY
jgi:hypothetical protein